MPRLLGGHIRRDNTSRRERDFYYKQQKKRKQRENYIKDRCNTPSYYKGIKLIYAWTERDGKEAFVIPFLGDRIIWVPGDKIKTVGKYMHLLKNGVDIDDCFKEAGCPVEHIHLLRRVKRKQRKTFVSMAG